MIEAEIPIGKIPGRRHEPSVVIVLCLAEGVVIHVNLAAGLEELDFVFCASLVHYVDDLLDGSLETVERKILLHQAAHALFYLVDVLLGNRTLIRFVQVAVIAVGDGMLDEDVAAAEHVLSRFAEQKTQ